MLIHTYISSYFYITEVTQREISAAPAPVVVVDPPILAALKTASPTTKWRGIGDRGPMLISF